MSELPDFKKILFPEIPPIPLEVVVPDAPSQVWNCRVQYIFLKLYTMKALVYTFHEISTVSFFTQAIDLLSKFLVYYSKKRTTASNVRY